jgi:hypothetical protein
MSAQTFMKTWFAKLSKNRLANRKKGNLLNFSGFCDMHKELPKYWGE